MIFGGLSRGEDNFISMAHQNIGRPGQTTSVCLDVIEYTEGGGREGGGELQILPQHLPAHSGKIENLPAVLSHLRYQFESLSKFLTITLFSSEIKIQP